MNKRFLSTLLTGAFFLAATSMFVSCKDYDDDIANLQAQIDKAALQSDLTALQNTLTSVSANASSALTKAEEALTKANSAATAADLASVKAIAEQAGKDAAQAIKDAAAANKSAEDAAAAAKKAQETADQAVKDAAAAAADAKEALEKIGKLNQTYVTAEELKEQITELKEEISGGGSGEGADAYKGAIAELYKAVTSVELIDSYTSWYNYYSTTQGSDMLSMGSYNWNNTDYYYLSKNPIRMQMITGTVAENSIFGDEHSTFKGETKEYKKGDNIDFGDGVIVRVSPVSADLTTANILLVNSQGQGLDDFVEAGTPERLEDMGLIITRGTNIKSGLWYVPFNIKAGVTEKTFAAATQVKIGNNETAVVYAIAINNTADQDADRYAVSSYDIVPGYSEYTPATMLDFTVNKTDVADIRNRWTGNDSYAKETDEYGSKYDLEAKELVWLASKKGFETPATEPGEYNTDATRSRTTLATAADDEARSDKTMVPVEIGKAFTVAMYDNAVYDFEYYYVTLDERAFAVESNPSEWVAWNKYYPNITNLNKLIPANKSVDITINDKDANGDILGFRVYAVNYDGTLVDPDGRAFYVQIGEPGKTANTTATYVATNANYNITAIADALAAKENKSDVATVTASYRDKNMDGTAITTFAATGVVTIEAADFKTALAADLVVKYTLLQKDGKTAATKWSEVAAVAVTVQNPGVQVDGTTVTFTVEAKDTGSDRVLNSLTVGVKKELPSEEFTVEWRASLEPVNGVLTVYPSPSDATHTWADGIQTITEGTINPVSNVITWPTSAQINSTNGALKSAIVELSGYTNGLKADIFDWIVKKVDKKDKANDSDVTIEGETATPYDRFLIDIDPANINKTFESEINAVYKDISLTKVDGTAEDYTITAWKGQIKFASIFSDLITYGNAKYAIAGNKTSDAYYYFYDATEEGKIYQYGITANKYTVMTAPYALKSLFSATWKGANAAALQTNRLKGWNAGLEDPGDGTINLLDYITFGDKATLSATAATLIEATTDGTNLTISNLPGKTLVADQANQTITVGAVDQFGAAVSDLSLKFTIKPETAAKANQ